MKIEHIALYVNDLEAARIFLPPISEASQMMATTIPARIFVLTSSLSVMVRDWN